MELHKSRRQSKLGRTRSKTKANAKQNTNGPARSASSMMCLSTLPRGFKTVKLFCRIWEGFTPSSAKSVFSHTWASTSRDSAHE